MELKHEGWRQHGIAAALGVREETISRLQRAMGSLGTAAMASMEERLPWFRDMSAENRSWVGLVAQAGIAAFFTDLFIKCEYQLG